MTMFEYTKKAFLAMKERPKKERWQYFLDYYKWPAIAVLLAIVILIQSVVAIVTRKDTVFSGVLVDGYSFDTSDEYMAALGTYLGINTEEEQVQFQTGILLESGSEKDKSNAFQQLLASLTVKATDFIVAPEGSFELCAYNVNNIFADLRNSLDADTLAKLEDKLYYIDRTLFKKIQEEVSQGIISDIDYPDPHAPEAMDDPIPVGIDISGNTEFCDRYYLTDDPVYLGMAINTTRQEMVIRFMEFLLS